MRDLKNKKRTSYLGHALPKNVYSLDFCPTFYVTSGLICKLIMGLKSIAFYVKIFDG